MFERYTERARRVLFFARFESSQFGSASIEPEHLLLGLLREGKGLTRRLFADAHLDLETVRTGLERRLPAGDTLPTSAEIPFSAPGLPIEFRDNAYWLRGEGQSAEGPYCSLCFDIDRRLVHKLTAADGTTYCEYCTKYRPTA